MSPMRILPLLVLVTLIAVVKAMWGVQRANATGPSATKPSETDHRVPLTFSGGYDTDPRDHGRPVILIASALKVPEQVFRDAFKNVHPAPAGQEPDPRQVRRNKEVLLKALAPYGVTNERLDEVSNYYRYRPARDDLWRHKPASGYATLRDDAVSGVVITDAGSGYSSPPKISIPPMPDVKLKATLLFDSDIRRNGSIEQISVE